MGQQQLLLLVLGIVIVGLAVVVGIQAFSENTKKANADALVNDLVRLASEAQAWMLKPTAFGGGGNSCATTCNWSGVTFSSLGYAAVDNIYTNTNGKFVVIPQNGVILLIAALNEEYGNLAAIGVGGTTPDLIVSGVQTDLSVFDQ